ncbi:hypothetical protein SEMRO_3098_G343680.1 [Seminavis robusta]|uniref:Uncharacterized protein n=1 Tax=Seminavis robusta TaxID=568900 RepID=A0A9N8F3G6_9STRA|nr:hypothetical protein SEMRO_3098_G343680.1 [Seminavis robusta]|eukprot:Sro3098_g343680.1 n/a (915) ;mRNA; f:2214-4958
MADSSARGPVGTAEDEDGVPDDEVAIATPQAPSKSKEKKPKRKKSTSLTRRPKKSTKNTQNIRNDYVERNPDLLSPEDASSRSNLDITPLVDLIPRAATSPLAAAAAAAAATTTTTTTGMTLRTQNNRRNYADDDDEYEDNTEEMEKAGIDDDIPAFINGIPEVQPKKRGKMNKGEMQRRRMVIAYALLDAFGAIPEDSGTWGGQNGIAKAIAVHFLHLPRSFSDLRAIKTTMRIVMEHYKVGIPYDGSNRPRKDYNKYYIPDDSFEMQLIADCIEENYGITQTTAFVNLHRSQQGHDLMFGRSTIYNAYKRLPHSVTPISKRSQGSLDKQSKWCRANYQWHCQLAIRFGIMTPDRLEKLKVNGVLPECYDINQLTKLNVEGVIYWDEVHKQVVVGKCGVSGRQTETRFKRDKHGKLDPNGTYRPRKTQLKMKYTEEARFSVGVALKRLPSGQVIGVRLPIFEYTSKNMVTHKDYEDAFWKEVRRPKSLKGDCYPWVVSARDKTKNYTGDNVKNLKHVGKAATTALFTMDVLTIGDFVHQLCGPQKCPNKIQSFRSQCRHISNAKFEEMCTDAILALPGPPESVDHRKKDNPYLSRFGEAHWRQEVINSSAMQKVVSVRNLVRHMYQCGIDFFKGSNFETNWHFMHDALSLMTAKETKDWMEKERIKKHWILPELGLNDKIGKFGGRPVGNNPRDAPADHILNKTHDDVVIRHVAATSHLPKQDPKKFSLATPLLIASAYKRVWNNPPLERDGTILCPVEEGAPSSDRIKHDIMKTQEYILEVVDNDGLNTVGKASIAGHRGDDARLAGTTKRGGARKKNEKEKTFWFHPDARDGLKTFTEESLERWKGKNNVNVVSNDQQQATMDPDAFVEKDDVEVLPPKEDRCPDSPKRGSISCSNQKESNEAIFARNRAD